MAEIIKRFKVPLTNIVTGDCVNPTVSYSLPQGITVPCVEDGYIIIEIDDSAVEHCIVIRVDCDGDCSFCGPFQERWCFCTTPDDCDECEKCENNVCVTRCEPGQLCVDDLCVDCDESHPCPKNQICQNGKCVCPASLPVLREDGLCVECLEPEDCEPCQTCDGAGNCVQKECDGHCHPITGVCQECVTDGHCTAPNECCDATGQCECCLGYIRDPLTGVCIPTPECFSAQDCIDALGPCFFCDDGSCAPTPCPNGQVCNPDTGDCEYPCTGGDCPDGYGCLNGFCVPCDTLSCEGTISECQLAIGCHCVDGTCEGIDCITGTTGFQWVQTPGTPGTVQPGTGEAPLTFNIAVTPQGIYNGYLNYAFDITATNGSGSWTAGNYPGQALPIPGATSTHVNFNLANGPVAGNLQAFIITFETSSGNYAEILFFSNLATDPNSSPENYTWQYDVNANGLNAQTTGGSPGSLSLCATNPDLIITQVSGNTIEGDLQLFFSFSGTNCAGVSVSGCGKWQGTVTVDCGGSPLEFPIYYEIPQDACCDPINDPTCDGDGDADGCTSPTNQNIEIYVKPLENNRWAVFADYDDVGLSPWDFFYLNPAGCWSKTANPDGDNDITLQTTPTGTFQYITFTNGGCIQLGEACTLTIGACLTISGEACVDGEDCTLLSVWLEDRGNFRWRAHPSQTGVSYQWTSDSQVEANQTLGVFPEQQVPVTDGSITTLTVVVTKGACTATASVTFNPREVMGCTESEACNFNETASIDDGSCIFFGTPSYACEEGFVYTPSPDDGQNANPSFYLLTKLGSVVISATALTEGDVLPPGLHWVRVQCPSGGFQDTLISVPVCWICNPLPDAIADCVQQGGATGPNIGWDTEFDCEQAGQCVDCDTSFDVAVTPSCDGGTIGRIQVNVSTGVGPYMVTIRQTNQVGTVVDQSLNIAPGTGIIYDRSIFADGIYYVSVIDGGLGCEKTFTFEIAGCFECIDGYVTITGASLPDFCDDGVITFNTFNASPIPNTPYTVELINAALTVVASQSYNTFGTGKTLIVGNPSALPAGDYTLVLTDLNGCTDEVALTLAGCGTTDCELISASLTSDVAGSLATFEVTVNFSAASGESFNITVQRDLTATGSTGCGQPSPNWSDVVSETIVASSTTIVEEMIPVSFPASGGCYRAVIQKVSGTDPETCVIISNQHLIPASVPPTGCSVITFDCAYDEETDTLTVTWDVDNTPSNGVYVDILVDSVLHPDSPSGNPASTNLIGETGVFTLVIPQSPSGVQNVEVQLDGGAVGCQPSPCMLVIPVCTCSVTINSVVYTGTEFQIDYESSCATTPADLLLTLDLYTDAFCTIFDSNIGSDTLSQASGVAIFPYPAPGSSENILITLEDGVIGTCITTSCFNITGCGNNCDQIVSLGYFGGGAPNGAQVTSVDAVGAVNIFTGAEYAGPDDADIEAGILAGLVAEGSNCDGQAVDVQSAGLPSGNGRVPYIEVSNSTVVLNTVSVNDANGDPQTSYWGNCTGCNDDHLCDYEFQLTLADTFTGTQFQELEFGSGWIPGGGLYDLTDAGDRTQLELDIEDALDGTGFASWGGDALPCAYTVGSVSVTEALGVVTITILGTNAPIGQLVYVPAVATTSGLAFISATQSNCIDTGSSS